MRLNDPLLELRQEEVRNQLPPKPLTPDQKAVFEAVADARPEMNDEDWSRLFLDSCKTVEVEPFKWHRLPQVKERMNHHHDEYLMALDQLNARGGR